MNSIFKYKLNFRYDGRKEEKVVQSIINTLKK